MTPKPTIEELERNRPETRAYPKEQTTGGEIWDGFNELDEQIDKLDGALSLYLERTEHVRTKQDRVEGAPNLYADQTSDVSNLEKNIYGKSQRVYELRLKLEQALLDLRL